jgi:hypothetical protein
MLKPAKVDSPGSSANFDDRREDSCDDGARHITDDGGVSVIGSRREQDHSDRDKGDSGDTIRPCGHDPEELGDADRDERAPRIEQGRCPIGHVESDATTARRGAIRIRDE